MRPQWFAIAVMLLAWASLAQAQEGSLQTIRDDVHGVPAPAAPQAPSPSPGRPRSCDDNVDTSLVNPEFWLYLPFIAAAGATSPIWAPHYLTGDDFDVPGCFPQYPYQDTNDGYIMTQSFPNPPRRWAARLDVEYIESFDHLESLGGHLLVETGSRFGIDASMLNLQEFRPGLRDHLTLGDCNLVFRFAQCSWAEFRAGLGINWMDDAPRTDFGFNATYAVDLYPQKPWVITAAVDWGTLGHAELFRFRTTAGVVFHGVEVYTGYEYTDIDRTQWQGLIAGLRVWF